MRFTTTTVEIFYRGERMAVHRAAMCGERHHHDRCPHAEGPPGACGVDAIADPGSAGPMGPETHALADEILRDQPHPEQGYRSCLGLYRLGHRYGKTRLEAACARARAVGARSYRHVDAMLKHGLDRTPVQTPLLVTPIISPEHVRGPEYYQSREEVSDAE